MTDRPPIRILIADESLAARTTLRTLLETADDLEVVGTAANGMRAIGLTGEKSPDVVLLSPTLINPDGLTALARIREAAPGTGFVALAPSSDDARADLGPHSMWATRPTGAVNCSSDGAVIETLFDTLRHVAGRGPAPSARASSGRASSAAKSGPRARGSKVEIIAIGSSTGGPDALEVVLSTLPPSLPVPIVIAQHMPPNFTRPLADRLESVCHIRVSEGREGERLEPGHAYIAPGGFHMLVERKGVDVVVKTNAGARVHGCRPAVDPMMDSVAEVYGASALAVVLTGMGCDGANGCVSIHEAGGHVLIQDETTSVVWGMPGAVHRKGVADEVLPLGQVSEHMAIRLGLGVVDPKNHRGAA